MITTIFEGEHLMPGNIGRLAIIVVFVASLIAAVSFFFSEKKSDEKEKADFFNLGKWSFIAMSLAMAAIFSTLFYIIYNHYFEYYYAWRHSSLELPVYYIISSFWEGQEGSFLLWMFWQTVLGLIILKFSKSYRTPVLMWMSLAQMLLCSMLLGIYIFDYRMGSNPFTMLRDAMQNAPIFKQANYLSFITDGNGLNPLLQNYWMVIHPPVLFLGFASCIVPFAFAMSGWWRKDFDGWTKPALGWTLFNGVALTTGIMMGAAWAYEALSFGGYWAWDPVENASLMPWLTLIAGLHTLLAYKYSGHAQKATFILFGLTFLLVLYASFLTRSGILGTSSVHAFTDDGLGWQLGFNIFAFLILFVLMIIFRIKKVIEPEKEEEISSREFWMFIGALVLLVSVIQVTFTTSIPVFNKFFNLNWAPPSKPVEHYNKIQVWIAILLGFLTGATQYLRFKKSEWKLFVKSIWLVKLISISISAFCIWYFEIWKVAYWIMLYASVFAVIGNVNYLVVKLKSKFKLSGASIAHVGFGVMLLGILISSYKQKILTENNPTNGMMGKGFDDNMKRENMLLVKNATEKLNGYDITYVGDSSATPNTFYKVHYVKHNTDGSLADDFYLYPNVQENKKMGTVNNPSTKHYFSRDIYTIVTAASDKKKDEPTDTKQYQFYKAKPGDTIQLKKAKVLVEKISNEVLRKDIQQQSGDIVASVRCRVFSDNQSFEAEPIYLIRNQMAVPVEAKVEDLGVKIFVNQILPNENKIEFGIAETTPTLEYITLKAMEFPYINLLWLGTIITIIGFVISIWKRVKKK